MVTKAWKLYVPKISRNNPSAYYDWSDDREGTRIMEVLCADLIGHASYILLRITRDTEEDVEEEFKGQLVDGYFEHYRGDIRGLEVNPKRLRISSSLASMYLENIHEYLVSEDNAKDALDSEESYVSAERLAVIMSLRAEKSGNPIIVRERLKDLIFAHNAMHDAWRVCYGYRSENTEITRAKLKDAVRAYNAAVLIAITEMRKDLRIEGGAA